jgi:hypothetical protein
MFGNNLGLAQFTSPQHSTIYLFPWLNCDLKVVFFFHKRLYRESVTRTPNQPWPVYRQYIQPHSGFLGNSRILISAVFTPSTRPELPASLTEDDAVHWQTEHTTITSPLASHWSGLEA